jgi:hypothetical protein
VIDRKKIDFDSFDKLIAIEKEVSEISSDAEFE